MRTAALFVAGTVVGYVLILFGWIAAADLFAIGDRDGGKIMGIAFAVAPLGGLVIGVVSAIALRRRPAARDR